MCIRRCCVRIFKVPLCCVYKAAFCLNIKRCQCVYKASLFLYMYVCIYSLGDVLCGKGGCVCKCKRRMWRYCVFI